MASGLFNFMFPHGSLSLLIYINRMTSEKENTIFELLSKSKLSLKNPSSLEQNPDQVQDFLN